MRGGDKEVREEVKKNVLTSAEHELSLSWVWFSVMNKKIHHSQ